MKVLYVSGPYDDPRGIWYVTKNIEKARDVAAKLWQIEGVVPLCPHLNSPLMGGLIPRDTLIEGDLELVERSDGIIMIGEWGASRGAIKELSHARALGKRVFFEDHMVYLDVVDWSAEGRLPEVY
jgi:hypothetical protein